MVRTFKVSDWTFLAAIVAALLVTRIEVASAQSTEFDAAIGALRDIAKSPVTRRLSPAAGRDGIRPSLAYPMTLAAEPPLVSRLERLFEPYFDRPVHLAAILHRLVLESAVSRTPGIGLILYNPVHMLFLHLPEGWEVGGEIRVATLDDVDEILRKEEKAGNPLLTAYVRGFERFTLLVEAMKDAAARETLEIVWAALPRADADKDRMRYLLIRPVEQAAALQSQTAACRDAINRFVDDVRAGKEAKVPMLRGLTDIVQPTQFARYGEDIYLVLGEKMMARYYVLAHFKAGPESCSVDWQRPVFAM